MQEHKQHQRYSEAINRALSFSGDDLFTRVKAEYFVRPIETLEAVEDSERFHE